MMGCQPYSSCEAKKLTSYSLPLDHIILRSYREVILDLHEPRISHQIRPHLFAIARQNTCISVIAYTCACIQL